MNVTEASLLKFQVSPAMIGRAGFTGIAWVFTVMFMTPELPLFCVC